MWPKLYQSSFIPRSCQESKGFEPHTESRKQKTCQPGTISQLCEYFCLKIKSRAPYWLQTCKIPERFSDNCVSALSGKAETTLALSAEMFGPQCCQKAANQVSPPGVVKNQWDLSYRLNQGTGNLPTR